MSIEPGAGFPLDPDAALRARVADLERQAAAFRGTSSGYDAKAGTVSTNSINYVDLGGPSVTLTVPAAGAFVELYAEAEGRDVGATGIPGRAGVYEANDLPIANPDDGTYLEFNTGATFELRRLVPGRGGGSQTKLGLGGRAVLFASGGQRTYSLRYCHIVGNVAEFRNRRLWARVVY